MIGRGNSEGKKGLREEQNNQSENKRSNGEKKWEGRDRREWDEEKGGNGKGGYGKVYVKD